MESLHSALERAKRSPYDFILATRIQKKLEQNKYVANCILFSDSNLWGLDNVLTRKKMLIDDPEKTYSVELPEGEAYNSPDGIKLCKKLCNDGEIERVTTKAKEAKTEHKEYPSDNAEIKSVYYNMIREKFLTWYQVNMLDSPKLDRPEIEAEPMPKGETKKQQYEKLFNRYYNNPNADPDDVKRVLNDDPYWKNASAYLHPLRRAKGLSIAELKSHPGFTWINLKNNAID